jgi:hypothetical protein
VEAERRLFALNKTGRGDTVEVFAIGPSALTYVRSLPQSSLLTNANDLAALSSGEVYVTNSTSKGGLRGAVELLRRRPTGSVVRWTEPRGWTIEASGIPFANGIAIDDRGKHVFVGSTGGIRVFSRGTNGKLTSSSSIPISGDVDNLSWDTSRLIAASHPSRLRFIAHAVARIKAPSCIYECDVGKGMASLILEDSGENVSACSTAIRVNARMYLGQVLADGVVRYGSLARGAVSDVAADLPTGDASNAARQDSSLRKGVPGHRGDFDSLLPRACK